MSTVTAERLAGVFVELADTLVDHFDLIEFLHKVTARTTELVGTSAAAGLLLADHQGQLQVMAASEERAVVLQVFQVQTEEGPCQDAFRSKGFVMGPDLRRARTRWPLFAHRALSLGYRSAHAFPLRLRDEVIGAMGLFGTSAGQMDSGDVVIVQALADVATIGLLQERAMHRREVLTEQLQAALDSRVAIEQAKGVLAQIHGSTVDEAFERLRDYCRSRNLRLTTVAQAVVTDPTSVDGLTARSRPSA